MIKMIKKMGVVGVTLISSLLFYTVVYADGQTTQVNLIDPLGGNETFASVATAVAGFLFWDIAIPLCTIMVLVGSFQMITSSGDPEKFSQGRKTILYAAIGFAIALIAGSVTNIIRSFISGS